MIQVLHVLGGLGTGGTESLIMNWYRNIDRTKIQFDFLVRSPDNNYLEEITKLGGRVFYTASFPRHFFRNFLETRKILKRKEWDVIHVHGNAAMYMLPLRLAKKLGYTNRIMHSHSIKAQNKVFLRIHNMNKMKLPTLATQCLACSAAAGKWMFADHAFSLSQNAIDVDSYRFDSEVRTKIRKGLGIENKFVVGHVGRFAVPKNHEFLLNVFAEMKRDCPESILMLVGDGELETSIKAQAEQLGVADSVLFMGRRSNVGELMSAMDMFVLPSLYEGLGIVLVEAQCNGLPCVVSQEAYNEEVNVYPDRVSVLPLSRGAEAWADHILSKSSIEVNRNVDLDILQDRGYDMKAEIKKLEELYLQAEKGYLL